ncbi:LAMI_0G11386g1_1 [Lachancea mirantina]|uniref:LAMI_0G11386g1_1 n=1 Tax=Lachancea mirantina TaxID=1230905 RepID=A0A1G4KB41_9SACH|nr:LAMI_0G11386g1_1 [Lachancea mirantina]
MSFFGFDSSGPKKGRRSGRSKDEKGGQPLDFDETYQGFGEHAREEDDYLNSETFGDAADVGTDFDFGYGASEYAAPTASHDAYVDHSRSYASAATSGPAVAAVPFGQPAQAVEEHLDFTPMESLWTNQPVHQLQQPQFVSMEEIERQQQQQQQQRQMGMLPQQHAYMSMPPPQHIATMGYGFPGQPFVSGAPQMTGAPQFQDRNVDFGVQAVPPPPPQSVGPRPMSSSDMPPMQYQQMSPGFEQVGQQQSHVPVPAPVQANKISEPHHAPQQVFSSSTAPSALSPVVHQAQTQTSPVIEATMSPKRPSQQPLSPHGNYRRGTSPRVNQGPPYYQSMNEPFAKGTRRNSMRKPQEHLSEEDWKRLQVRQAKVDKILKHSGVMTPRDKDFITRYQLSQIVTDDPYNEDFYFQVYKIIQRGGVVGESNKGLIARAYLEHSGHRLGGRYKRADVALQRMQSQVEKAVTVAKERPQKNKEISEASKEGVLGKISASMNSKAPRRQLQIPTKMEESDETTSSAIDDVAQCLQGVDISTSSSKLRRRSSYALRSLDQSAVLTRSGGRKFVLSLIETVYSEVLELEAQLRSGKTIDSSGLWEALHIFDDAFEVSPFISILSFDKGVKIMPRIINFLGKEQKLKLLSCFFSELSHLNIVVTSSYRTNPNPTGAQLRKIELFQSIFLKIIVSFLSSSAEFMEVMGLLLALVKNNNVSFITTSKIGLNLITVLISRAALIKQDVNRGSILSSSEISSWNEIYDKLFTALETRLSLIFPPSEYTQKIVSITNPQPAPSVPGTPLAATFTKPSFYDSSYIWQFLASLALSGKLNHQRIIIDEVRDEIFGTISKAEEFTKSAAVEDQPMALYQRDKLYQDLNLFLNVMGLVARDGEISELK